MLHCHRTFALARCGVISVGSSSLGQQDILGCGLTLKPQDSCGIHVHIAPPPHWLALCAGAAESAPLTLTACACMAPVHCNREGFQEAISHCDLLDATKRSMMPSKGKTLACAASAASANTSTESGQDAQRARSCRQNGLKSTRIMSLRPRTRCRPGLSLLQCTCMKHPCSNWMM